MPASAPSTGWRTLAFGGPAWGIDGDRTNYLRYGLEARRYFDLYAGDRVLLLRAYAEGVTAVGAGGYVPFTDLPRLGGPQQLRGYTRDRFRDRLAVLGTVEYRYPIWNELAGFLFVDAGRVLRGRRCAGHAGAIAAAGLRVGGGGGLEMHQGNRFRMRGQLAGLARRAVLPAQPRTRLPRDLLLLPDLNHDPPHLDLRPRRRTQRWLPCWLGCAHGRRRARRRPPGQHAAVSQRRRRHRAARGAGHPPAAAAPVRSPGLLLRRLPGPAGGARRCRRRPPGAPATSTPWTRCPTTAGSKTAWARARSPRTSCAAAAPRRGRPSGWWAPRLGGVSPGMRVRDAGGSLHLLKFDRPDDPDAETATDVILQRLLWAAGYHTPDDSIVYLRRRGPGAGPRRQAEGPARQRAAA